MWLVLQAGGLGERVRPGGGEATGAAQAGGEDARDSAHARARRWVFVG